MLGIWDSFSAVNNILCWGVRSWSVLQCLSLEEQWDRSTVGVESIPHYHVVMTWSCHVVWNIFSHVIFWEKKDSHILENFSGCCPHFFMRFLLDYISVFSFAHFKFNRMKQVDMKGPTVNFKFDTCRPFKYAGGAWIIHTPLFYCVRIIRIGVMGIQKVF